jgi:transposase
MEVRLAAALAAAGLPVAVVNPRQVRAFARATGRLAKTDRLDAAAIARFAEAVRPPVRPLARTRPPATWAPWWRAGASCSRCSWRSATAATPPIPALHGRIDAHLGWLGEALAEIERDLDGRSGRAPSGGPRRSCCARCRASAP